MPVSLLRLDRVLRPAPVASGTSTEARPRPTDEATTCRTNDNVPVAASVETNHDSSRDDPPRSKRLTQKAVSP